MSDTSYDFGDKYRRQSFAARLLIDRFFAAVGRELRAAAPQSVLEVGCGEGFSTQRLAAMLGPAVSFAACDVEERLVAAARAQNPSVPITRESIYGLPRPDAQVELVLALEVLEHLEEPERALRELLRVSSRFVLLSVPREPLFRAANFLRGKYVKTLGNTPGHIQHWSAHGFARLIRQHAAVRTVRTPFPWTLVLAEKSGTQYSFPRRN